MARPVKSRTTKSYQRDVEAMNRLRSAIMFDKALDWADAKDAIDKIDSALLAVRKLVSQDTVVNT